MFTLKILTQISQICEQSGDKTAIKFYGPDGGDISYRSLWEQVNDIALRLKSQIDAGQLVALALPRTPACIVYILAALKAGSPFLALDINLPVKRIETIMQRAGASVIVVDQNSNIGKALNLSPEKEKWSKDGLAVFHLEQAEYISNHNLAYIMFTSGSSGEPKGVMVTRHNLDLFSQSITTVLSLKNYTSILANTSFSFDISMVESLVALTNGMTIHLTADEYARNPHRIKDLIAEEKIDIIQMTPSQLRLLHKYAKGSLSFLHNVKLCLLGAEAFPEELTTEIFNCVSGDVYNLYGPTEATVWASSKKVTANSRITIGKPLPGYSLSLHDEDGNAVPQGEKGEIWISGAAVADGYVNRNELTVKVFTVYNGQKTYKTGDIGVELEDGDYKWLGRVDNQIKLKGKRVELEEIEIAVKKVTGIENAVVLYNGGSDLVCYYVPRDEANETRIKEYLSDILPEYMIPTRYIKMDSLPTGINGKTIRTKLQESQNDSGARNLKQEVLV